jgi:hypothetical protein
MKKSSFAALLFLSFLVIGLTGGTWTSNQFCYKPGAGARGAAEKNAFDSCLDRIDTRLGKEIWVGDPAYGATLQSAITAIGSNQVILRVPPGTHSIAADLSIPAHVSLKVERGAILSVATTKTLTVNGGLDAGLYPVITCAGTGSVVFGNQVPRVFVQWTGAVGDNSTDDSIAINLAAAIARASACKRITLPPCVGYKTTTQLDLTGLNIEGEAKIYSTYAGTRVKCGGLVTAYSADRLDIKLFVDGTKDWTNAAIINIWISQTDASTFDLSSNHGTTGIKVEGGTSSFSYNTFTLRQVLYNKIGMLVHVPAAATGWCNENLVLGGEFNNTETGAECCIKFLGEGSNFIHKWTFVKPSLEHKDGTAAVIFTNARECQIQDARYEYGSDVPVAQFNDQSYGNTVTLGSVNRLPFTWLNQTGGSYGSIDCDVRMSGDVTLHRLTDVSSFAAAYNDGTYMHVPGFQFFNANSGAVVRKLATDAQFSLIDGHGGAGIKFNSFATFQVIGITVDFYDNMISPNSSFAKKLYVKSRLLDKNQESQIIIQCFDSAGAILTGTSPAYVQGNRWAAYGSNAYKVYGSNKTQALSFHPDVAKVFIGVAGTSSLTGLEVFSPYQADGYLEYNGPKELPGVLYAANAPTKWHFQIGEKVHNDTPAVGAPQGWTCIKRTSTTLTANGSGGNLTITVDSIAGIASGDIIGVKLNTGLYHFTTVYGSLSGNDVTLTAAIPGTGVVATSGNAVVANLWQAMPNL